MHANNTRSTYFNLFLVFLFFMFLFLGNMILGYNVKQATQDDTYIPTPRGSTIISVRLPVERANIREYMVDKSGIIQGGTIEGLYGQQGQRFTRTGEVPAADMVVLNTFIDNACRSGYPLPRTTNSELAYAVGIRCPGYIIEARVPADQAPPILERLRDVLVQTVP